MTFIAILAGIATFIVTQFIGAFAIGFIAGTNQTLTFIANYGPTKLVVQVLMWSSCAWLGVQVFGAIA